MLPEEIFEAAGLEKPYRAAQIFRAIQNNVSDIESITTLPGQLRKTISERFTAVATSVREKLSDEEGNGKLAIALPDSLVIECVALSDSSGRITACLSTQAGCAMGCAFCKTGETGFFRNLLPFEIVEQFFHLENSFGKISNIVFMGMGEPLENLENLSRAAEILNNREGKNTGYRKMTLSTCGLADRIVQLAESGPPVRLALSLNSAIQEKREKIMPVSKKFSLKELKGSLLFYQDKMKKRITLEYVLLNRFNTSKEDAKALSLFAKGLSAIVNLIPLNPVEGIGYAAPGRKEVESFCSFLDEYGINYTLRRKKGRNIKGACGQLAYEGE